MNFFIRPNRSFNKRYYFFCVVCCVNYYSCSFIHLEREDDFSTKIMGIEKKVFFQTRKRPRSKINLIPLLKGRYEIVNYYRIHSFYNSRLDKQRLFFRKSKHGSRDVKSGRTKLFRD